MKSKFWMVAAGIVVVTTSAVAVATGMLSIRQINGADNRAYTSSGDWSYGNWKGECAPGELINGLSMNGSYLTMSVLCDNGWSVNYGSGATIDYTSSDSRRDTSTGDWDSGYVKGECGKNEALSGFSENGSGVTTKARCVPFASGTGWSTCTKRIFRGGDSRGSTRGGDWSSGNWKGQCADNQYVKGVSKSSDGKMRSIYCCTHY